MHTPGIRELRNLLTLKERLAGKSENLAEHDFEPLTMGQRISLLRAILNFDPFYHSSDPECLRKKFLRLHTNGMGSLRFRVE